LKLDTPKSRVGTVVKITGSGFPAENTKSGAASTPAITIKYGGVPGGDRVVTTVIPDASGNVSGSFMVPLDASIPSTNTVRAEFITTGSSPTTVSSTTTHEVPEGTIIVTPISGVPGTQLTIKGEGFKAFTTVSELKVGDLDVRPSPNPNTDNLGSFTTTLLVPQLSVGAQTVTARVGGSVVTGTGTVASAAFTVTAAPVAGAVAVSVAPAAGLAPLGANLVRVWGFEASTQKSQLYDPASALLSDLTLLKQGKGYWINVKVAQKVIMGSFEYDLSAGWNNIGWQG
jgi:hypothetical protein